MGEHLYDWFGIQLTFTTAGAILAETFVATFVDPGLTLATTYAIFLIILLVRPQGLFGTASR